MRPDLDGHTVQPVQPDRDVSSCTPSASTGRRLLDRLRPAIIDIADRRTSTGDVIAATLFLTVKGNALRPDPRRR